MLYLSSGVLEKNSGKIGNWRNWWSKIPHEIFPMIAVLIPGSGMLQKTLSIRVLLFLLILAGSKI